MSDIVRVLRVIEYIGPREWVEETLARRAVKRTMGFPGGEGRQIRESVVGEFPEVLHRGDEDG